MRTRGLGEDKMCWIPSKDKGFMVSDYYRILVGNTTVFLRKVFGSIRFPLELLSLFGLLP